MAQLHSRLEEKDLQKLKIKSIREGFTIDHIIRVLVKMYLSGEINLLERKEE